MSARVADGGGGCGGTRARRRWRGEGLSAGVRPGVEEVRARPLTPSSELIKLDFPTFDRPRNATSGNPGRGQSCSLKELLTNSVLVIFIGFRFQVSSFKFKTKNLSISVLKLET